MSINTNKLQEKIDKIKKAAFISETTKTKIYNAWQEYLKGVERRYGDLKDKGFMTESDKASYRVIFFFAACLVIYYMIKNIIQKF